MTSLTLQEDYALNPASRAQLVKDLTPNTEEYYLYRLRYLSQQLQTGEVAVTAKVLEEAQALIDAAESSRVIQDSKAIEQLVTQLAFLAYPVKPDHLLKQLNLDPAIIQSIQGQEGVESIGGGDGNTTDDEEEGGNDSGSHGVENLSTELDPALVSTKTMTEKLLNELEENFFNTAIPRESWPYLLAQPKFEEIVDNLDPDELLNLFQSMTRLFSPSSLEIISQADTTRIDLFVVKTILRLYKENKIDFSDNYSQFGLLTRAQIDLLKKEDAALMDNEGFVGLLEKRIVPEAFATSEDAAYKDWLDKMVTFVDGLSPKFEKYKVSVYLLSLTHDLKKGTLDKAKFLRYVVLSRGQLRPKKKDDKKISVFYQPESDALYWSLPHWSSRVPPATLEHHDEVETEYLSHFIREAKSATEFEPYFEVDTFLNPLLARIMLTSGDKDLSKWSNMLSKHENLSFLTKQTILKFAPNNPSRFLPSDAVVFKLRAKNAPRILVRVFEVKTFDYLQQHESGFIGEKLNLDGLTPNWEHTLVRDHPALEMHDITIELPELANKRGAFVMDVISNGESSSAYFTKGYLDFIERQSAAGHVLTIIDEKQQKLTDKCSIWISGHYYKPNGDGDIIVPYRKAIASSNSRLYLIHDGFATRRPFTHRIERYNLQLACHIDHESLVAGATSKIVLKPTVFIDQCVNVPVNFLEQVELTIDYMDTNRISAKTMVPDFKLHDDDWSDYTFQVPENLSSLSITLSAKIKVICCDEFQSLLATKTFTVESPGSDASVNFEINGKWDSVRVPGELLTVLRKNADGYRVLALGKNGERRVNIPLEFDISHPLQVQMVKAYLRTDNSGQVFLGRLEGIDSLTCNTTTMSWSIAEQDQLVYPETINSIEGETISVPIAQSDADTIRRIGLFSTTDKSDQNGDFTVIDDHTGSARYENGLLSINGLKPGYYILLSGIDTRISIVVASSNTARSSIPGLEDFIVGSNPMLEVLDSARSPLYISPLATNGDNQAVNIQLHNWSHATRVCVIASRFVPYGVRAFNNLSVLKAEEPWWMDKTEQTSTAFKIGRVLGEEYQYVLNRKSHSTRWAGNLLTKPSTLLTPWVISDTTQSKQVMNAQVDSVPSMAFRQMAGAQVINPLCRNVSTRQTARMVSSRSLAPPTFNFLATPSVTLINLIPDPTTGLVTVPFSALKEGSFLQVIASDGNQILQQSLVVPRPSAAIDFEFQRRDLRFKSLLDYTKHYIGERTGVDLDPKVPSTPGSAVADAKSITLASNGSSSAVRVINSVSHVFDLMLTLLDGEDRKQTLQKFSFVVNWDRLSNEAKKEKFSKWNCHELNLFLYKKDRVFFDAVVAPFLKNKLMKSFLDNYLIGAPLDKYASLKEFNELTCMEKCLLAQRVPATKPAVVRWMKDRVHHTRGASLVKVFQTVMNSGKMKHSEESREESDDDMGFGLFDDGPVVEAITATTAMDESFDMLAAPAPMAAYAAPPAPSSAINSKKKMAFMNIPEQRMRSERIVRNQFKPVDLTKEMGETYYYNQEDFKRYGSFDEANLFWLDLAQWDESQGSFLSQNFVVNTGSFTDAMATLALLDVTFRPKDASLTRSSDQNLVITSQAPAVIFHSSTKEVLEEPVVGSVLVTQRYFEQNEKMVYDESLKEYVRKYIQPGQEFRPLESYGAHVVLMNGTPNSVNVHLEVQIPQGAISINGSLESGHDIRLSHYSSFQYEYGFYFPDQGDFPHYPAHVSNYQDIIAFGTPNVLKVREPTPDRQETLEATWGHILKNGTRDDILSKLESSPFSSLPIEQLLPRLYKDRQLLKRVTSALRTRQEYDSTIWSAAFAVQNEELIKEYLDNRNRTDFRVGDWFTSSIYTRRPHCRLEGTWDDSFKYLEYFPLINARTHKATRTATILNDKFREQYSHFLQLLSQKPKHDADDLLILIVYLLAQDRISEAKDKFKELHAAVSSSDAASRDYFQNLQYDYLWAYLSLCFEVPADTSGLGLDLDLSDVQAILDKYKNYPVERWSKMFEEMQLYVDEINQSLVEPDSSTAGGLSPANDESNSETDAGADGHEGNVDRPEVPVTVDFKIGAENVVVVRHRGVREVTVEYYSIDAEAMFSASPLTFADQGENSESTNSSRDGDVSNSYRLVKPNGIDTHHVKRAVAADGLLMIPILPQYLNSNVMVSVTTSPPAANRTWKAYYSQTIVVQCLEQTGTIKAVSKAKTTSAAATAATATVENGRPIRGGYVKVYAEMKSGSTAFWKDGYTDLVGRFAYAQVSTGAASATSEGGGGLNDVKRFVVYLDGGREGCVVKTLPVPPV